MDTVAVEALDRIEASFNYLVPMAEKPVAYTYEPPPGIPQRNAQYAPHRLAVRDGRRFAAGLSLDREGFLLAAHETAVTDFYDDAEVVRVYYPEVERLMRETTGAEKVVIFDHTVRSGPDRRGRDDVREPVRRVHNDYTEKSGPQRVRDLLEPGEAEARLRHRFAIVNVWRPIRGPVEEAPLALCDARSIAPADLVASDLRYPDRIGETYAVTYNPAHRWFYFPRMRRDEVVFIKCYDSATDGRARFAAHSAFDDPATPAGARPRESIEIRTLVFFPPDGGR